MIIASKNRPADIVRALASLRAQRTQPERIIVVDQSDARYTLPDDARIVHVYDPQLGGLPAARNRGVREARADFLLFLDDDVEVLGDVVPAIVDTFDRHADAVGAQCPFRQPPVDAAVVIADESRFKRIFSHGFFEEQPIRRANGCQLRTLQGCAMAFRRSLFAHELFDEGLAGYAFGEDWDFAKRAQRHGTLWVAGDAQIFHHRVLTNRHKVERLLQQRMTNFTYFFRKMRAGRRPVEWLWLAWWLLGECFNAARNGVNPLRLLPPARP
ncbi:MAG: glycosyltransferase family 2 protein [Candidatus Velthaea sp.]